jgi:hypothetical protein
MHQTHSKRIWHFAQGDIFLIVIVSKLQRLCGLSVMGDSLDWMIRMVILDHDQVFFFLQALEGFYENFDTDFIIVWANALEVFQHEDDLNETVQVEKTS